MRDLSRDPCNSEESIGKKWHQILGELRSVTLAVPGTRGLFSHLQEALHRPANGCIKALHHAHDTLDDFRWLVQDLGAHPAHLQELALTEPSAQGTTDASEMGSGGVVFPPTNSHTEHRQAVEVGNPVVWRAPVPTDLQRNLQTDENPTGMIANSDSELAAMVLQHDIFTQLCNVRECTTHNATDNTPSLFWQHKGSASANNVPACLLRLQALHQ